MPTVLMLLDFVPNQKRTFETFLIRLTHELRVLGWKSVFVFSGQPSDAFAAQLEVESAEYRVCAFPLRRGDFADLIASLRGLSPLVMTTTFVSCFSPYILRIKRRLGIRYWLVHDQSSGVGSNRSGLKRLICKLRGWYYGLQIDRVLGVSEFVARRNVEQSFLPKSRVTVLRNAVDLDRFQPSAEPRVSRPGEQLVVFVGQLIPEKGVKTLLRAMLLLKQRGAPVLPVLEVAGRGALEGELRAYTTGNGMDTVRFLGQVADVRVLYQTASVVVVPSEWAEAAAFVITEAMACGACVLASDAGGNPDVVGRDEEGARLFRSGDANDLAEKLLALLGDATAQERYRRQARARVERLFDLNHMVRGFIKELQDVVRLN